jgi:hypothetical protein
MSCQKLSSLNRFNFENLQCLLIIVRSGNILLKLGHIGEMHEKLAIELNIADNQCCTSCSDYWVRLDWEVTEVLRQEWSLRSCRRSFVTTLYSINLYTIHGAKDPMVIILTFKIKLI